jgi:hypothetical protein
MEWRRDARDGGYRVLARSYNRARGRCMTAGLRFLWTATRGHRLQPWRSEYLKWRLETFTGKHAEDVGPRDFWRFLWAERRQILRFLRWLSEMRAYASESDSE